jgi:ribokinase
LEQADVVVVGSLNVDRVLTVNRLPAPGETVSATSETKAHGGKGANQAFAAARLGAQVAFVGIVGDDLEGREGRESLSAAGVDVSHVRTSRTPTGSAMVVVDSSGDNLIVLQSGANEELTGRDVRAALEVLAHEQSIILASLEVPLEAIETAAVAAEELGARFVLNPAPARTLAPDLIRRCDVLVPNEHEVLNLGLSLDAMLVACARAVVVTRGSEGAELFVPGERALRIPAPTIDVHDTTGAGDAFVAALTVALQEGAALQAACRFAVAAGSLATTQLGARGNVPSRSAIMTLLGDSGSF